MALALLILLNCLYAGTPALTKLAALDLDATTVVWLRHASALLLLSPIVWWWQRRHGSTRMYRREHLHIAAAAFLGMSCASILQVEAMHRATATSGAIMIALEPLATIGLAVLFLREHFDRRLWLALITALLGVGILSHGRGSLEWQGNLLYILAIICEAAFPILLCPLLVRHQPMTIIYRCLLWATLYLLPWQWTLSWSSLTAIEPSAWASLVYLAAGCSALGGILWLLLLQRLPVSNVAISWFLQPVCGSLFAIVLLAERLTVTTVVGASIILLAMGLLQHPTVPHLIRALSRPHQRPGAGAHPHLLWHRTRHPRQWQHIPQAARAPDRTSTPETNAA